MVTTWTWSRPRHTPLESPAPSWCGAWWRSAERISTALGIDVEAGDAEIDRWFMAATLFGARIPTTIAEHTFHVLDQAGVTAATARAFAMGRPRRPARSGRVYARYDYKTATRLHTLCDVLCERYGGRVCAIADHARTPADLEEALDDLPGWGPGTVRAIPARAPRCVAPRGARTRPTGGSLCPPPRPLRRPYP